MELARNSPELTALDLIKPRTELGQSLHSCNEDIVWITESPLKDDMYGVKKTGIDYLKGEEENEEVRGGYSCWLVQCSTCIFSYTQGKTFARLWNSPCSAELTHSHKKLLSPSLYFGGLATRMSLGTLIGSELRNAVCHWAVRL